MSSVNVLRRERLGSAAFNTLISNLQVASLEEKLLELFLMQVVSLEEKLVELFPILFASVVPVVPFSALAVVPEMSVEVCQIAGLYVTVGATGVSSSIVSL